MRVQAEVLDTWKRSKKNRRGKNLNPLKIFKSHLK